MMIIYIKKNKIKIILFLIILLLLFRDKINLYIETTNFINTKTNGSTIVTPVLDFKIAPDKNIIYCATAQMAWNSLHDDIIKETIEIENQPWYVEKLNDLTGLPPQISQDAFVALAGFGKDNIIEKIKEELIKKFKEVPGIIQFPNINTDDLFAFSYLKKVLDFKEKFGTFYSNMIFNNKTITVKAFGFEGLVGRNEGIYLKKQIKLLHFSKNGFILELITMSEKDACILSTIKPEDTLKSTYDKIIILINNNTNRIINSDIGTLVIPKINFDIEHYYEDIVNKKFKNLNFKKNTLTCIIQCINFKLNERGARIESYNLLRTMTGDPLNLKVNGPFTLFFKDKSATYPYFMAYFGNDKLLEK